MKLKFICQNDNIRLNDELKLHISRKLYRKIKSTQTPIYVNGSQLEAYKIIKKGDVIQIELDSQENIEWPIYESNIKVVYESDNYLVINKPFGLLSIPTKSEPKSVYQEVLYYLKNKNEPLTVSLLNRLDKDTMGLMVIAKNRYAAFLLQPTHAKMTRKYKCLCHGKFKENKGKIETFIDKNEDSHKRFISTTNGKKAISNYNVLKENDDNTLVEFILETGRTHQIRLHTSYLGNPICGDKMYGIRDDYSNLCLLSYYVSFYDQFQGREIEIEIKSEWE